MSSGGVYDNHGLEPIVKRYMTLLVSDGGAPFARNPEVAADPIRQMQRVFAVTDSQVRSLRRRDLINRFKLASKANLQPNQIDANARLGAYWGIDTDPSKAAPAGALPAAAATVNRLAHLATRLSDPGTSESKQLVNWGYTICDRCIRTYYKVPDLQQKPIPQSPYPDAPLG
jgi:NTE family protein